MHELSSYRIVGSTSILATLSVNLRDINLYQDNHTPAIKEIRSISAKEFNGFYLLFNESSIVLAYSWLDTYLSEVEETMFLHDPTSLGESVEIKLGKVLSCASLDELIHDLARRRARERGQWGLKNRISELKKRHGFQITVSDSDIEWMSDFRNNLVHNRRIGAFKTVKGKVQYMDATRRDGQAHNDIKRFMSLSFTLLGQLYKECSNHLGLTRRFSQHRQNMELIERFPHLWR